MEHVHWSRAPLQTAAALTPTATSVSSALSAGPLSPPTERAHHHHLPPRTSAPPPRSTFERRLNNSPPISGAPQLESNLADANHPNINPQSQHLHSQSGSRLLELEQLVEQSLREEGDKLDFFYQLNQFEVGACSLSELLANLLQKSLAKVEDPQAKHAILALVRHLFVQPKLSCAPRQEPSEGERNSLDLRLLDASIRRLSLESRLAEVSPNGLAASLMLDSQGQQSIGASAAPGGERAAIHQIGQAQLELGGAAGPARVLRNLSAGALPSLARDMTERQLCSVEAPTRPDHRRHRWSNRELNAKRQDRFILPEADPLAHLSLAGSSPFALLDTRHAQEARQATFSNQERQGQQQGRPAPARPEAALEGRLHGRLMSREGLEADYRQRRGADWTTAQDVEARYGSPTFGVSAGEFYLGAKEPAELRTEVEEEPFLLGDMVDALGQAAQEDERTEAGNLNGQFGGPERLVGAPACPHGACSAPTSPPLPTVDALDNEVAPAQEEDWPCASCAAQPAQRQRRCCSSLSVPLARHNPANGLARHTSFQVRPPTPSPPPHRDLYLQHSHISQGTSSGQDQITARHQLAGTPQRRLPCASAANDAAARWPFPPPACCLEPLALAHGLVGARAGQSLPGSPTASYRRYSAAAQFPYLDRGEQFFAPDWRPLPPCEQQQNNIFHRNSIEAPRQRPPVLQYSCPPAAQVQRQLGHQVSRSQQQLRPFADHQRPRQQQQQQYFAAPARRSHHQRQQQRRHHQRALSWQRAAAHQHRLHSADDGTRAQSDVQSTSTSTTPADSEQDDDEPLDGPREEREIVTEALVPSQAKGRLPLSVAEQVSFFTFPLSLSLPLGASSWPWGSQCLGLARAATAISHSEPLVWEAPQAERRATRSGSAASSRAGPIIHQQPSRQVEDANCGRRAPQLPLPARCNLSVGGQTISSSSAFLSNH